MWLQRRYSWRMYLFVFLLNNKYCLHMYVFIRTYSCLLKFTLISHTGSCWRIIVASDVMASLTSGDGGEAVTSVFSVSMLVDKISLTIYNFLKLFMYDYLYLLIG